MKHEKALKAGIKVNIIVVAIFFSIVFAVSAVDATDVNVVLATQTLKPGDAFSVNVTVENVTYMGADQATLLFNQGAMNVTSVREGDFLKSAGPTIQITIINNTAGTATFSYSLLTPGVGVDGSGTLATINFATNPAAAPGKYKLDLTNVKLLNGDDGEEIHVDEISNGTVTISALTPAIDTGPGTYPSIFGTHNGTITPNQTITVSRLYTYPCSGTGGHAEYARIWNNSSWEGVEAHWNGYIGDWHNISFNKSFTLVANETYYYTIRTGSYPQIIHAKSKPVTGGTINCTEFIDANGRTYTDWIPAIRLEK